METIEIQGFRGFKHLTVQRLGRVNLIVGKNNVGKSSFLEALRLYGTNGSPWTIRELLWSRDEMTAVRRSRRDPTPMIEPERLFRMFNLHHNPTYTPFPIRIGPVDHPDHGVKIRLEWYSSSPGANGRTEWHPVELGPDDVPWSSRPGWIIESSETRGGRVFLDSLAETIPTFLGKRHQRLVQYLPSSGLDSIQLGRMYDQAIVSEGTSDVLNDVLFALRLIAPDLEEVLVLGEGYSREVLIRMRGKSEPVPLRSLGEGMTRVLGIILGLVTAKNTMLLVDELENGIHYSVMAELWQLIFRVAEKLNVQVFVTTHSWDCIEGFQRAATTDTHNVGMLIRLEHRKGEIQATVFDEDELTTATRERIEVR